MSTLVVRLEGDELSTYCIFWMCLHGATLFQCYYVDAFRVRVSVAAEPCASRSRVNHPHIDTDQLSPSFH